MNTEQYGYQPKGGQCATCTKVCEDCSRLPFASMPVIGWDKATGAKIVRCTQHERPSPADQACA